MIIELVILVELVAVLWFAYGFIPQAPKIDKKDKDDS